MRPAVKSPRAAPVRTIAAMVASALAKAASEVTSWLEPSLKEAVAVSCSRPW